MHPSRFLHVSVSPNTLERLNPKRILRRCTFDPLLRPAATFVSAAASLDRFLLRRYREEERETEYLDSPLVGFSDLDRNPDWRCGSRKCRSNGAREKSERNPAIIQRDSRTTRVDLSMRPKRAPSHRVARAMIPCVRSQLGRVVTGDLVRLHLSFLFPDRAALISDTFLVIVSELKPAFSRKRNQ